MWKQLIKPDLGVTDLPGWCLRLVGNAFGLKRRPFKHATEAWNKAQFKRTDPLPTDVAVPVYYSWYGTIDGITQDWGDVAIHVPGKGVFGSPKRSDGRGNRFDKTVADRAKWLGGGAQYRGWSEDLNLTRLIEKVPDAPKPVTGGAYTIKKGDTFWALEAANGWTHGTLQTLNPGVNPTQLAIGQPIVVPGGAPVAQRRTYKVVKGDTLWAIAVRFYGNGGKWQAIYNENRAAIGNNPNVLKIGTELVIP